ncbi:MAG: ABC-2 family transporter protein [Anaerolineae bacterium]|nr:ABC-2 family transporter protein [Anaerolineae bacterium]
MSLHNPGWLQKYRRTLEMGLQTALEYRVNFAISLIGAIYPIIIQSFLWTAIYDASSETELYGYTYRQIIVYTFLAGLISRLVHTGFEYDIMDDVKNGKFSNFLVQPIGYFPYRLANFFGQKLPNMILILIILAVILLGLNTVWGISITLGRIVLFLLTLVLALVLNFIIFYAISAIAFWLVEIGFLFEGIRIVIILLSGGIFPLEVFGPRFVQITNLLPFKYTVSYPINVLNGRLSVGDIGTGMITQCVWIVLCMLLAAYLWRVGSRRYVAVGG